VAISRRINLRSPLVSRTITAPASLPKMRSGLPSRTPIAEELKGLDKDSRNLTSSVDAVSLRRNCGNRLDARSDATGWTVPPARSASQNNRGQR